jgi:hypothetical protein
MSAINLNILHNMFNPRVTEYIICILLVLLKKAGGLNQVISMTYLHMIVYSFYHNLDYWYLMFRS